MERSKDSIEALLDKIESLSDRHDDQRSSGSEVHLNIYDMLGLNHYTTYFGLGAFHTGVEVYGKEYAYGGHPYSFSGVYDITPKEEESIPNKVHFRESLRMGHTSLSSAQVADLILDIGKEYNGKEYHICRRNCNHFSSELCYKLCGVPIPHWVNRLAYVSTWMPFMINCLPPSWFTPGDPASVEDTNGIRSSSNGSEKKVILSIYHHIIIVAQELESDSVDSHAGT